MSESDADFYDFNGIRFYPKERRLFRLNDKAEFFIRPKERDFLELLLIQPRQTVLYQEFRTSVWPEAKDLKSVLPTIRETKRTLDDLLGEITKRRGEIIETVAKRGYRLNADVETSTQKTSGERKENLAHTFWLPFGGHRWHVLTGCCLYGALYALAIPLELAYQFDRFRGQAVGLAPSAFCWIFVCAVLSLYADWKLTLRGKLFGLAVLLLGFISSAIALFVTLTFFLPDFPITESINFQASTAQGAYLKNVAFYFLPLGIVFFALPYHFILALSRATQKSVNPNSSSSNSEDMIGERGTGLISVRMLGLILFGAAIVSLLLTFHLLNNLKPSPYQNLFTLLVILRATLIFGLGLECVLWYSHALRKLAIEGR
jgi:DNA-binding winged helix-turn-helix (wHTH) protein